MKLMFGCDTFGNNCNQFNADNIILTVLLLCFVSLIHDPSKCYRPMMKPWMVLCHRTLSAFTMDAYIQTAFSGICGLRKTKVTSQRLIMQHQSHTTVQHVFGL